MELKNNTYEIGNVAVEALCEKYGTPLYVYATDKITAQYHRIKKAFGKADAEIHYACKALSNINILRHLQKLGAGLDAVSPQEIALGLRAGFSPEKIIFTPNSVNMEEYDYAVEAGVKINIDSISMLDQFGEKYGKNIPVSIRVNPHVMAGGNKKISVGHIDSKFGISVDQLDEAAAVAQKNKLKITGIHMHAGSDILDIEAFIKGMEILLKNAERFKDLEMVDLGSGFKVPYKPDDKQTDMENLGERIAESFHAFCKSYGRNLQLIFEPGKFLVSEAGIFLARVNVIKKTPNTVFAGLNTGQNHFIRPMFYDAYHHILNVSNPRGAEKPYSVVGYICETDTFAWKRPVPELREGDIVAFKNAGAYCFSMASNYNSRLRPAEVMVHEGKAHLIRKRETLDDLLSNQVEVL
jgi:diaminopimelate decarboxylase